MIYQDPLAYLLGLEGIALLDAWAGDHDRAFTEARLAEIRRLLGDERLRALGAGSSPAMLPHARQRVPEAEFHVAGLDRLPLPDDSVDVIVCALALEHVPRLEPVLAEFARVLRPGGDLGISDIHHELLTRGSAMTTRGPAGEPRIAPSYRHQLGDYLRAALRHGLQVKRCEEPRAVRVNEPPTEPATEIGDWQDWPFSLTDYLPSAGRAPGGAPHPAILHFPCPARRPA